MAHPYCTQSDIEARIDRTVLASLTNDTAMETAPDKDVVSALIEDADSRIDAEIGQVYDVPLSTIGTLIKQLSIILTVYFAYQRRSLSVEIPKSWNDRYEKALKTLEDIANLRVKLDNVTQVSSPEAEMVSNDQIFNFSDTDNKVSFF